MLAPVGRCAFAGRLLIKLGSADGILAEKKYCEKAFEIAASLHPAWTRASVGAKKLLSRNVFQILGGRLDSPSDVVVAWTEGGGGTGFALRIAYEFGVPVVNVRDMASCTAEDVVKRIGEMVGTVRKAIGTVRKTSGR